MLDQSPKSLDFLPKGKAMCDVAYATGKLDEMIGTRGVRETKTEMLDRAYDMLVRINPKNWRGRQRRVRAIYDGEARRIDHFEIKDIETVIKARREHAEYLAETARLAATFLGQSADRMGDEGAVTCSEARGMDCTRDQGCAA